MKVLGDSDIAVVAGGIIGGGPIQFGQLEAGATGDGGTGYSGVYGLESVTVYGEAVSYGGGDGFSLADGAQIGGALGAVWGAAGWLTGAAGFTAFASIGEAIAVGAMVGGALGIGAVLIGGGIAYFIYQYK